MATTQLIDRAPLSNSPAPATRPTPDQGMTVGSAQGTLEAANAMSVGDARAIYDAYRRQIEHEDNLLNNRASWLLMAQSFFVVAYSILHQLAPPDVRVQPATALLTSLLGWLGVLTPIPTLVSVFAASRVMTELRQSFAEKCRLIPAVMRVASEYPSIQSNECAITKGRLSAVAFPVLFLLFWGTMIIKTWISQGTF